MNTNTEMESRRPSLDVIEQEMRRLEEKKSFNRAVRDILRGLIVVAAIAVLISTMWIPVFQIYGSSMAPTLNDGEIVLAFKESEFQTGEIAAFYYNNNILMKRVIAQGGDVVDMLPDGTVIVNDVELDEPYLTEKSFGESDIAFPFTVPPGRYFVLGDHRETSIDSRTNLVGTISEEQIVGKVVFKLWPLGELGRI